MNKDRRSRLRKIIDQITDLKSGIEEIKEEEQDSFDNLPESLQQGEKGSKMEEAISNMEDATNAIDEIESSLNSAQE